MSKGKGLRAPKAVANPADLVITAGETVTRYKLSESAVRDAIRNGRLPRARKSDSGGDWIIPVEDAEALWGYRIKPDEPAPAGSIAEQIDQIKRIDLPHAQQARSQARKREKPKLIEKWDTEITRLNELLASLEAELSGENA